MARHFQIVGSGTHARHIYFREFKIVSPQFERKIHGSKLVRNRNFHQKILLSGENYDFWRNFCFFDQSIDFNENVYFSPKFQFLSKISIFWRKFRVWIRILNSHQNIFEQNFEFSTNRKFRFLDQNCDLWRTFRFLTKMSTHILISQQNFSFWLKLQFLTKISFRLFEIFYLKLPFKVTLRTRIRMARDIAQVSARERFPARCGARRNLV